MRRSLTPWTRFSAALSLLFHLMLVGVGPAVDAHLEAEALASDDPPVHVEDGTGASCRSGHDHQVCLIRALHSMDAPPGAAPLRVTLPLSSERRPPARFLAPAAVAVSTLGPRGPPAV